MAQKKRAPRRKIQDDEATIRQALQELGIDVPYTTVRLVGNRLEFHLLGGAIVTWPPPRRKP